jgi:predicted lipoprotein with Yx(FWY)xxD motif
VLVGPNGKTLYLYTRDQPGLSNCYDACAVTWPPLLLQGEPVEPEGNVGELGWVIRRDGTKQATYNGWPLYYYVRDMNPGDTTGQNVGTIWFVLNPTPEHVQLRTDATHGQILVGPSGWTLYMYTRDEPGVSNCYDACAITWPPLLSDGEALGTDAIAAGLGLTERRDGSWQYMYNDMPLYYFLRDNQPTDTAGHNVGTIWFVLNP